MTTPYRGRASDVPLAGQLIRQVRIAHGITQQELATLTGTSRESIARAELGRRLMGGGKRPARARVALAHAIENALGQPLSAVLVARPRTKAKKATT